MEWQQLEAFRHLARTGSFSAAARATYRTQPAVSQQIKALEEELGCPLVAREGRRYAGLTPAGRRLLAFCQSGRAGAIPARGPGRPGRAHLWPLAPGRAADHPDADWPRRCLREYAERFPEVELTLWDRPQAQVRAMLAAGEADLGLGLLLSTATAALEARPWRQVRPVLLAPKGHALARRRKRLEPTGPGPLSPDPAAGRLGSGPPPRPGRAVRLPGGAAPGACWSRTTWSSTRPWWSRAWAWPLPR